MPNLFFTESQENLFAKNSGSINGLTSSALEAALKKSAFPPLELVLSDLRAARQDAVRISYDQFRQTVEANDFLKTLPKLSSSKRKSKAALSEKAAEYIATEAYEAKVPIPEPIQRALGGKVRTLKAFFGSDLNENTIKTLNEGTPSQVSALFEKTVQKYVKSIDLSMFEKPLSDAELIKQWPAIRKSIGTLCLEYANIKEYMSNIGGTLSFDMQKKINAVNKVIAPFYSYYKNRLEIMSGEYFSYLPDGFESSELNNEAAFSMAFDDDSAIARSTSQSGNNQLTAVAEYVLGAQQNYTAEDVSGVYLENGESVDPKDYLKIAEYLKNGQSLFIYHSENDEPDVVKSTLTMPPKITHLLFDPVKNKSIQDARKEERANTKYDRILGMRVPVEPDSTRVARFEYMLAHGETLTQSMANDLLAIERDMRFYEEAYSNVVYQMDHVMYMCCRDIFGLNPTHDKICVDVVNFVAQGKSLEEIKAFQEQNYPNYGNYVKPLYDAAKYDLENREANRKVAATVIDNLKFKNIPTEKIENQLAKVSEYPVRSKEDLDKFTAITDKIKVTERELALTEKSAIVEARWAAPLLKKPGITQEDADRLALRSRTPEGRQEIFREIIAEIKAFDPSQLGDIDLSTYADNLQQYEFMRLITFDYSYFNDPECQKVFNEMYSPADQEAFKNYIRSISGSLNSLKSKVKLANSPFSRYVDFEKMDMGTATKLWTEIGAGTAGNEGQNYAGDILTFINSKPTKAEFDAALSQYLQIAPNPPLRTFSNTVNPVFNKLVNTLLTAEAESPELSSVKGTLTSLCVQLEKAEEEGGVSTENLDKIKDAFKAFNDSVDSYLSGNVPVPEDVRAMLIASKGPLDFYASKMDYGKSVNGILNDMGWIETVFKKTQKPEDEPGRILFDASNASGKECADKYKELIQKAQDGFNSHLKYISGDEKNPVAVINAKTQLMVAALQHATKGMAGVTIHNYNNVGAQISTVQGYLDWKHPENSAMHPAVNESFFRALADHDGPDRYKEVLGFTNIIIKDPNVHAWVKAAEDNIEELAFSAKNFGLTEKDVKDLSSAMGIFSISEDIYTSFQTDILSDTKRNPLTDPADPLHEIFVQFYAIEKARVDYLAEKEGAVLPDESYLGKLSDSISAFTMNENNYLENRNGQIYLSAALITAMQSLKAIRDGAIPDVSEKAAQQLSQAQEKIQDFCNRKINEFCTHPQDFDADSISRFASNARVQAVDDITYIDPDTLLRLETARMIREDAYCKTAYNENKQYVTNPENVKKENYGQRLKAFVIASLIKKQTDWMSEGYTASEMVCNTPGTSLMNMINHHSGNGFDASVNAFIEKVFDQGGLNYLFNTEKERIPQLLADMKDGVDEFIESMVIGENDLLRDVPESTMAVFGDTYRAVRFAGEFGIKKDNSEEFTNVANALMILNQKRREPGGTNPEEYLNLYNACKNYANTRSPKASTEAGRARFKAASEMMLEMGLKLKEKFPDQKAQIDADLKLLAIRSNAIREKLSMKGGAYLKEFANEVSNVIGNKNVDTAIKSPQDASNLLAKFAKADEKSNVTQLRAELIVPGIKAQLQAIKDANLIENQEQRIDQLAGSISKLAYLNQLNSESNKMSKEALQGALSENHIRDRLAELNNGAMEFAKALSAENVDKIMGTKDAVKQLCQGLKLYDDLIKSQSQPEMGAPETREVKELV